MENKIKNKSNTELAKMQKEITDEYEKVRYDLLKMYNYWMSLEKKYNEIVVELNNRFGVNNK